MAKERKKLVVNKSKKNGSALTSHKSMFIMAVIGVALAVLVSNRSDVSEVMLRVLKLRDFVTTTATTSATTMTTTVSTDGGAEKSHKVDNAKPKTKKRGRADSKNIQGMENVAPPSKTLNTKQVKVRFVNDLQFAIALKWSNDEGVLMPNGELEPNAEKTWYTFEGHVFVIEKKSDGSRVKIVRVTGDATVNASGGDGIPPDNSMHVLFYNNLNESVTLYWSTPQGKEIEQARLGKMKELTFNTFPGHVWVWRKQSDGSVIRTSVVSEDTWRIEASDLQETPFHEEYKKKHGYPWLNVYPAAPCKWHIHETRHIGYKQKVLTTANYWTPSATQEELNRPLELELETMQTLPKIFIVKGFLSQYEASEIIRMAEESGELARSTVTHKKEIIATRTSYNMWMNWDRSPMLEHIYRRGFELLKVPFSTTNISKVAESLQVLRYEYSQEYRPHYDWFGPKEPKYITQANVQAGYNRYATLFLYLNDVAAGGETVFPRAGGKINRNACEDKDGFRVKPHTGSASLFYSMMPDGNLDEFAEHGSCPIKEGTKYGANWWFWSPQRFVDS